MALIHSVSLRVINNLIPTCLSMFGHFVGLKLKGLTLNPVQLFVFTSCFSEILHIHPPPDLLITTPNTCKSQLNKISVKQKSGMKTKGFKKAGDFGRCNEAILLVWATGLQAQCKILSTKIYRIESPDAVISSLIHMEIFYPSFSITFCKNN